MTYFPWSCHQYCDEDKEIMLLQEVGLFSKLITDHGLTQDSGAFVHPNWSALPRTSV